MTSVERLKFLAEKGDECWLGLSNVEAIKEVLEELEKYKMLHLRSVASRVANDLKTSEKHKEDLEMLYEGCKVELEKKDKVIDLIVNTIVADKKILGLVCKHIINKTDEECEKQNSLCDDCIKEYFYKKVE